MSKVAPTTAALIIPALNEEAILGFTLQSIPKGLYQMIVVADNGSTDRTVEVATDHGATVVSIPERGYGAACLAAIRRIPPEIDAIVFMQADMSEAPDE